MNTAIAKFKKGVFKRFFLSRADRDFSRTPARIQKLLPLKTDFLLATVVWNDAELVALQYQSFKNLTDPFDYLVADTSSNDAIAREIEAFCADHAISYVRLPSDRPGLDGSLYHGLAINWVFRNVVMSLRPQFFGLLDPDLFVVAAGSFLEPWRRKPFWGLKAFAPSKKNQPSLWRLWPGFSFFARHFYETHPLNFLPSKGLDTGGSNARFFENQNSDHLITYSLAMDRHIPGTTIPYQIFANVIHLIGGVSLRTANQEQAQKKRAFARAAVTHGLEPNENPSQK